MSSPALQQPPRFFVPPQAVRGQRLLWEGPDAQRVRRLDLGPGDMLIALDNSGWELTVALERVTGGRYEGRVVARRLAPERRTKVSVYQGLLHPADFRRLLAGATELGVVAFVPVITETSVIPTGGLENPEAAALAWQAVARDAAEASGRGRCPTIGTPMLLDHAVDQAVRSGSVLVVAAAGRPLGAALVGRPFSINVFLPSPGGFTAEERTRASARGAMLVSSPEGGADPIHPALAALAAVYDGLEGAPGSA